jgi:hypothetical protein
MRAKVICKMLPTPAAGLMALTPLLHIDPELLLQAQVRQGGVFRRRWRSDRWWFAVFRVRRNSETFQHAGWAWAQVVPASRHYPGGHHGARLQAAACATAGFGYCARALWHRRQAPRRRSRPWPRWVWIGIRPPPWGMTGRILPVMRRCAVQCAPINAHAEVRGDRELRDQIKQGGHGAVREFCDLLLVASGRYVDLLDAVHAMMSFPAKMHGIGSCCTFRWCPWVCWRWGPIGWCAARPSPPGRSRRRVQSHEPDYFMK